MGTYTRPNLPRNAAAILRALLVRKIPHVNKFTALEKQEMSRRTGLDAAKITRWLSNNRTRHYEPHQDQLLLLARQRVGADPARTRQIEETMAQIMYPKKYAFSPLLPDLMQQGDAADILLGLLAPQYGVDGETTEQAEANAEHESEEEKEHEPSDEFSGDEEGEDSLISLVPEAVLRSMMSTTGSAPGVAEEGFDSPRAVADSTVLASQQDPPTLIWPLPPSPPQAYHQYGNSHTRSLEGGSSLPIDPFGTTGAI
jgi:hypothetical protein